MMPSPGRQGAGMYELRSGMARRSGDDGFTLVCEEIADAEVQTVADRVIEAVGQRFNIDGRLTPVTIRSGVAVGRGPGSTSSWMMAEAEAAVT